MKLSLLIKILNQHHGAAIPFLFIICPSYLDENLGFTLSEKTNISYPAIQITDVDYVDDLVLVIDNTSEYVIDEMHTYEIHNFEIR